MNARPKWRGKESRVWLAAVVGILVLAIGAIVVVSRSFSHSALVPAILATATVRPAAPTPVPDPTATVAVREALVPPHGPFFYVNQFGAGTVHAWDGHTRQISHGALTLPNGAVLHLHDQYLYTFEDGRLVKAYRVSTGKDGATPVRSGTLRLFDRGKTLTPGDPGWIVQGGVYVDDFWALFPDADSDSQILIHTLPFQPKPDGTHDTSSYEGEADLGNRESSAGCIRMAPPMFHRPDGFDVFTAWAKARQAERQPVLFTIGP